MPPSEMEQTKALPVVKPGRARMLQLDGLRAVAILSVIASHSGFFPLGWAGVHLFFVLSGFLITGILRRSREDEYFWSPFYVKRATRILPPQVPFFLFCAFTVAISWKTTGLAYIFFGANIVQSIPGTPVNELTVLWSLAVEEHFYFLWPFAVRYWQRRTLMIFLAALLVADPIARAIATPHFASWMPIYFLTCFQLDGLAAGSLLALLVESEACRAWLRRYAVGIGVAAAAVYAAWSRVPNFAREDKSVLFNAVGYSLIVLTCVCALAYLYLKPQSRPSVMLAAKPMAFIGGISYGMYLFAGPVFHALERFVPINRPHPGRDHAVFTVLAVGVVILVSWVSFRFYETPIMRWGHRKAAALGKHA